MADKKYSEAEFQLALSKGIANATGRRGDQLNKMIQELGFKDLDEVKALKQTHDTVLGERDQYKVKFDEIESQQLLAGKRAAAKEAGIDESFIDFAIQSAADGDFAKFIADNPKMVTEQFKKINSDGGYDGGKSTDDSAMREAFGLPKEK